MFALKLVAALLGVASATAAALPANSTVERRAAVTTISNCKVSGQVALTFDDGPYVWNGNIRNTFAGSKGTFFVNGNNYGCIYDHVDEIRAAHAAGWTIGNHGWSHAHMGQLSWDQVHDELWRVEEAMIKILGVKPIYFRPPYGETSGTLYAALENRGYKKLFLWSDDSGDTTGASAQQSKDVYNNVANSYPAPHIILNHETKDQTVFDVIPYAVPLLKNRGYQLVSVDTCLGSEGEWPYQYVGPPQQRDASWHC